MATKLENLALEIAHWQNFVDYMPGTHAWDKSTVADLLQLGVLEVSTGFEHALAHEGGCTVTSTDSEDLSNGDDAKLSTVRTCSLGTAYSAPVTNISGKTGALRVQVYERKQNLFYYFVISNWAYSHIPRSSNIEIPFELNGDPRRRNRCAVNWWQFEVDSFEELAQQEPAQFEDRVDVLFD